MVGCSDLGMNKVLVLFLRKVNCSLGEKKKENSLFFCDFNKGRMCGVVIYWIDINFYIVIRVVENLEVILVLSLFLGYIDCVERLI